MPTAANAAVVKAYKKVSEAVEAGRDKDLTPYMKIVYKRCIEDGLDPLEMAAAFLRMSLGETEAESALEESMQSRKKAGARPWR